MKLWNLVFAAAFVSCGSLGGKLAEEPPPLVDMEEPLELFDEPQDEALRVALPTGGFTGIYVDDQAGSLDDLVQGGEGVVVTRVVENSPAAFAGLEAGDILLEAGPVDGPVRELKWSSEWRELELSTAPGTRLFVLFDRAESEREAEIVLEQRLDHDQRGETERFREEDRVGIVLRTATEVEARRGALGPGGGAVVVGMAQGSPWRGSGLRFGDMLTRVGDRDIAHPRVLLEAIAAASPDDRLRLEGFRDASAISLDVPLSRRGSELNEVFIPPLFSPESRADRSEWSVLLGLFGYEETKAAWEFTFLWFLSFSGGDADRLEELEEPDVGTSGERP
ncbi:MAG: PDZ domain-containing protein [Planctomycetes bacterium]|nr:PDZ domain-containing protein [Planctomycetota bacterium]